MSSSRYPPLSLLPCSLGGWAQALPKFLSLVNVRWYQFVLLQGHLGWRRVESKPTHHEQCWCWAINVYVLTPASNTESSLPSICYQYLGEKRKTRGEMAYRPFHSMTFHEAVDGRPRVKSCVWFRLHCQQACQHTMSGQRKWVTEWPPLKNWMTSIWRYSAALTPSVTVFGNRSNPQCGTS